MMKGHAVPFGQPALMLVVRDDGDDVDREIAGRPAVEQVVEAMAALRHRDDEARLGGAVAEPRVHGEARDDWRECGLHSGQPPRTARYRAGSGRAPVRER